ncbi:hypothetical protein AHF37_05082 [Paragonimus kellicotti]|nr:hypothetical protein AHF37_05082 [Paragonimus kellicotti]
MTHQNLLAQPICIQSSKLIEWLLNRKLLQKDYPKRLLAVVKKLSQLINGNDFCICSDPNLKPLTLVSYLNALQLVEKIEKEDKTTDFFGRASQNVRVRSYFNNIICKAWRDIIESYEKSNLHLGKVRLTLLTIQAEISEQIQEIAAENVPKCKNIIADRKKLITDLRQKIKEHTLNLMQKEDALEKFCKEFQLEVKEENVKLKLLEKAADIPDHLSHFVGGLKDLKPALDLYETVANCIHKCSRNSARQEAVSEGNLCHTLALLIASGHVRLFTWLTNREPERIEADDDFIPDLLLEEQNILKHTMSTQYLPSGENVTAVTPEDIVWGDTEEADKIDFDTLDLADDEPIEIEVVDNTTDLEQMTDSSAVSDGTGAVHVAESNVASGKTARLLLDTAFRGPIRGSLPPEDQIGSLQGLIVWGDTEEADKIDFDTLDLADDEPIEIEVVDNTTDLEQMTDSSAVSDGTGAVHVAESNVASGKTARLLLDTAQGRIALLNDLVELGAFLSRFTEDQMELQGCVGGAGEVMDTTKRIAAVVDNTTDLEQMTDSSAVSDGTGAVHVAESNVASGKTARLLLDTAQGRIALLNDLVELGAFLSRFTEDQMELQGCVGGAGEVMDTTKRIAAGTSGGSITLQSMILQNAPSAVHSISAKESSQMLALVEHARAQLTNSSMSQLLMIRNKPGYLDRLIGRMTDLKNQVTRVKSRMLDAQLQIDEACSEQEHQAAALVQYRTQCKQLVSLMEKELTRICNRKIQIIGQVLDL